MAQASYIPTQDAPLKAWANNFATLIAASPGTFGLLTSDAVTISSFANNFSAAMDVIENPATKTKPSVANKDALKASMLGVLRPYAQNVRNNAGVTDENKLALGLNVPSTSRTPITVPQTQPLLSIIGATPGVHTIRYADVNTPDKRSKPFGAIQIGIFATVGAVAATNPEVALFQGGYTVQPLGITWSAGDVGKVATYWGRYIGRRGDFGPWSAPVSMVIV